MAITDIAPAAVVDVKSNDSGSYVDWPAIFAGAVLASAFSLLMLTFGSALGLSLTSAHENQGIGLTGFAIAAGLWLVWVQVSGFMAGGYLTGRLRRRHYDATEHESNIRDGSHGLVVWGVGVLVGAVLAFSGATAAISTAASVVGGAASTAVTGVAATAGGAAATDNGQMLIDRLFRATPGATAPNTPPADAAAQRDEIGRIIASAVTTGTLSDEDKQYITTAVAARTGQTPEQVQARVDQVWQQAQEAEAKAREAAEHARKMAIIAAFVTAASLLVGAAGAYYGSVTGGNHRDKQTVFEGWSRPW